MEKKRGTTHDDGDCSGGGGDGDGDGGFMINYTPYASPSARLSPP